MRFRSIDDLASGLAGRLHRIPPDVDLVVGIPRSGMLPATLVALYRNLPLSDLDGWLAGRTMAVGTTRRGDRRFADAKGARHVLVVDDSVNGGRSIRAARRRVEEAAPACRVTWFAAYVAPGQEAAVDVYLEVVPTPRVFEWNVLHHPMLKSMCLDIDGVLCRDPLPWENDDGPRYRAFLTSAPLLQVPSRPVGWLVSNRLERFRGETEIWLNQMGVRYDSLELLNLPDAAARRAQPEMGAFKADLYARVDADLFVESEWSQAEAIARLSGKPVLCWESRTLVTPGMRSFRNPRAFRRRLIRAARSRARGWYHRFTRFVDPSS